jgi:hypothetical protein
MRRRFGWKPPAGKSGRGKIGEAGGDKLFDHSSGRPEATVRRSTSLLVLQIARYRRGSGSQCSNSVAKFGRLIKLLNDISIKYITAI